jgi:hypothetical protein
MVPLTEPESSATLAEKFALPAGAPAAVPAPWTMPVRVRVTVQPLECYAVP